MRKSSSLKNAKKKAWKYFSEYIRARDADKHGMCECISCGRKYEWKGGKIHAGHFKHASSGGAFLFDEENVNAQCHYCNTYLHGNQYDYSIRLKQKYGDKVIDRIYKHFQETKKFTIKELDDLAEYYMEATKEIIKAKGL